MKLLQKVPALEVKRAFVISDRTKRQNFTTAKKGVLRMSEAALDKILLRKNRSKRRDSYNKALWHIGTVKTNEVGVWKGAGGLPLKWTRGSLAETGRLVKSGLKNNSQLITDRAKTAIPGILKNLSRVQKEKYLLPIILPGGSIARRDLKRMRGDIDDGCMRSIALAVSGKKTIKAYIGKKK